MQANPRHSNESGVANPRLIVPYQVLSAFTAGLVLLQAVLAGQALYKGNQDYIDYHEIVGNLFFLGLIVQIGMTWLLTTPGLFRRHLLIQNGLILVLTVVQMGLGYSDSANAAAWHIPLGVFIFGYAGGVFSHAWGLRKHWHDVIGG